MLVPDRLDDPAVMRSDCAINDFVVQRYQGGQRTDSVGGRKARTTNDINPNGKSGGAAASASAFSKKRQ